MPPRAIFEKRCLTCHGQTQAGGLDLRQLDAIRKGSKRGPAVVPGHAEQSLLYKAVERSGELRMPPGKALPPEEIATLRAWINQGAPWDNAAVQEPGWWSFRKVVRPPVPNHAMNPIDAFILSQLQQKGLRPVAAADKRTLVRRAYYDLHGLPPSPTEVAEFVNDASPDAYETLVDRLLASPRYGERWGRHWLDVVRYGSADGVAAGVQEARPVGHRDLRPL